MLAGLVLLAASVGLTGCADSGEVSGSADRDTPASTAAPTTALDEDTELTDEEGQALALLWASWIQMPERMKRGVCSDIGGQGTEDFLRQIEAQTTIPRRIAEYFVTDEVCPYGTFDGDR